MQHLAISGELKNRVILFTLVFMYIAFHSQNLEDLFGSGHIHLTHFVPISTRQC